ncbi:HEAT repeat domain-containing protein [Flavobacterium quisquiliarum]|uniref:HEAT repeat domain-containing protein n=1 Tax=Flavobacterium quisquiliarum TaxID=1834436 RepID=A0ABV8W4M1_9FLAO|nr:hypothetical protein [Flavobacterium quisquiliarum]MBW1655505.1 hypothetical protein [Flavobacterium quisquiliarum]NWL03129.1 hypothetical protein [Flavobacterium collinsii]
MEKTVLNYSIKGGVFHIAWNMIFVVSGIYFLSIINIEKIRFKFGDLVLPIVTVLFIIVYGKKAVMTLFNFHKKIIFSQEGLELNEIFYEWKDIIFPRVIAKTEHTAKYNLSYKEFYLTFVYKQKTIEIKIDDYDVSENEIKELIKKYTPKFTPSTTSENKIVYEPIHDFDQIITLEQYYDLEHEDSEEAIQDVQKLAVKDLDEIKRFCENQLFTQPDKVSFIYYSLSEDEDIDKWADFLSDEFSRVFQIALNQNKIKELTPVLYEILVEDISSYNAGQVRQTLLKGLDHKDLETRLKALEFLQDWIDEEVLKSNSFVVSKLRQKLKDPEWKMRWKASKLLEQYKIAFESLSTLDKLRRFINP